MAAQDFWFAVVAIAAVAVVWTIVVLLVLDVRVVASLTWLERLWSLTQRLFTEQTPACAHCGEPAKVLGRRGAVRLFYCPRCATAPWSETEAQPGQAVAS